MTRVRCLYLISLLFCASAQAADRTWSGATDSVFSTAGNWDALPANNTTDDVGVFTGAPTANQPQVTGTRSIAGLRFESAGWDLSNTGTATLTVGTEGVDSAGAGTNTLANRLAIGGTAGTWTVGTGNTLNFTGLLSGSVAMTKDGTGTLEFSGTTANTWTGVLTVDGGVVLLNSDGVASLGGGTGRSITVNNGGILRWGSSANGNQLTTTTTQFTIATGGLVDLNGKDASFAFSGNEKITLSGGTVDTKGGLWTFTGNNAGAGAIINGTTVSTIKGRVHFGGLATDRTVNVANNAAGLDLDFDADIEVGDVMTLTAPSAGSGSSIRLGGNNAFTGNLVLNNGVTVYLDHANAMGAAAGANEVNGNSSLVVRGGINYGETGNTRLIFNGIAGFISESGNNTWNGALTNPGGSSALPSVVEVQADTLTLTATLGGFSSNSRQLAKSGDGALLYSNANNFNATLYIEGGTFAFANNGQANVRAGNYVVNGGTIGSPDNITMALGTSNTQVRFGGEGGGYAAVGADITVAGNRVWGGYTVAQVPSSAIDVGLGEVTGINFAGTFFKGAGYTDGQVVTFTGGGGSGAQATLQADAAGAITGFTITNPGSGYTTAPTVVLPATSALGDGGSVNFLANNAPLILNSTISEHKVTLTGTLNLADAAAGFSGQREIRVLDNPASSSDLAELSGVISTGKSGIGLNKTGPGTLILSGDNTYDGLTSVTEGTLRVSGDSSAASGDVVIAAGAQLAGSGKLGGTVSGAGMVAPGASPGILSAASVDPSADTQFAFEFTQTVAPTWSVADNSGNDVLRLTDPSAPFTAAMAAGNIVKLYFAQEGTFQGGFFTDLNADFTADVQDASFQAFLANPTGDVSYEGMNYYAVNPVHLTWDVVQVSSADFTGGTVANGWTMEFAVIPEPGTLSLLLLSLGALAALRRRA